MNSSLQNLKFTHTVQIEIPQLDRWVNVWMKLEEIRCKLTEETAPLIKMSSKHDSALL